MKPMYYLLLFFLIGCSEDVTQNNGQLYAQWQLFEIQEINDQGSVFSFSESGDWNCNIILEFRDNNTLKITTCRNNLAGRYEKNEINIEVSDFGGTKVNEDEVGSTFLDHIVESKSYTINDSNLIISGSNFNLVFTLIES